MNLEQSHKNLLAKAQKNKILIAAHRGTVGGNIVQNTIPAYINSLLHGADIIEVDAAKTVDDVFFAFHDGQEHMVLGISENIKSLTSKQVLEGTVINNIGHKISQKVETLDNVLKYFKGKDCLINIDRSWFYWEEIITFLNKYDMIDQIILKSPVEKQYLDTLANSKKEFMYMPIVKTEEELDMVLGYDNINLVALELIFNSEDHPLVNTELIKKLHEKNLLLWVNAITLDDKPKLSAYFGDNTSILNSCDNGWGWLINRGFDVIQTDWPMLLKKYVDGIK